MSELEYVINNSSIMKKPALFLLIILVVLAACKKSGTPGIDGKICKIRVMSSNAGVSGYSQFYYDNSGNLTYVKYFASTGDTTVGPRYFYDGNLLRYSTANIGNGNDPNYPDTIFYFFDGTNKLVSTIEHYRGEYVLESWTTNYFYNSAKQVVLDISKFHLSGDTIHDTFDSTIYSYAGNNVYKYTDYWRQGSGLSGSRTYKFYYDGMKNYYKAMGKPPVSLDFWSENNLLEMRSDDNTTIILKYTYLSYNESGYPTEIIVNPQLHGIVGITYECH